MTTRFGDALRREREARGLEVEDICVTTKVSAHHVLALEAGEISQLPGGVFRRGIVRGYLGAVGLDEVYWMEQFDGACRELGLGGEGDRDWVQFAENVKRSRTEVRPSMGWRWVGVALLVVSLSAIAWAAWHFVLRHRLAARSVVAAEPVRATAGVSGQDSNTFTD